MTTKITIESGSKADSHVLYAQGPLDSLPLTANVDGIEVEVSVSHSEPNALKVTLDYNEDATWEQYTTGEDIFEPVKIDDLPAEINEIVKIGVEGDRSINEYSGDVESYTVIDDFEKGESKNVPKGERNATATSLTVAECFKTFLTCLFIHLVLLLRGVRLNIQFLPIGFVPRYSEQRRVWKFGRVTIDTYRDGETAFTD